MLGNRLPGLFVLVVILASGAPEVEAAVVGSDEANAQGACQIEFPVNPELDPAAVVEQISDSVGLSHGARVTEITVQNGMAEIQCTNAPEGATVEATLPDDLYAALGPEAPPGVHPAAIVGGVAIGATGIGLGSAAAAGAFDDGDSRGQVMSPER